MTTMRDAARSLGRLIAVAAIAVSGCTHVASPSGDKPAAEPLHVAAASDLQSALPKVVEQFNRESPDQKVVLTFGASGQLAEQIKAGAPFDLFLAANEAFVKDLAKERSINPNSIRPYAVGSLVLAVHSDSAEKVANLSDLTKPDVKKIAIANPRFAPYGAAAKQALERSALWEKVEPKVVLAETVRQALQFVQTGNAEVGLVSRATADVPEVRSVDVDPKLYDPIVQSLGIVSRSKNTKAAETFIKFLTVGAGRAVLGAHGFKLPVDAGAVGP